MKNSLGFQAGFVFGLFLAFVYFYFYAKDSPTELKAVAERSFCGSGKIESYNKLLDEKNRQAEVFWRCKLPEEVKK